MNKKNSKFKPNYGNWISKNRMIKFGFTSIILIILNILCKIYLHNSIIQFILIILLILQLLFTIYMGICHYIFSFNGGKLMGKIHDLLLNYFDWKGNGNILDIGCGAGALTIKCAKKYPNAKITGIDYWSKEWSYAKSQCEENAQIENVDNHIKFLQGDASKLPFEDESFDGAVSNFVFHEVKTQEDKQLVIREALRVVKKGGSFAFHDLFGQTSLYGDMDAFVEQLRKEGITEIHYYPNTQKESIIPPIVTLAPWMLNKIGIIYGKK